MVPSERITVTAGTGAKSKGLDDHETGKSLVLKIHDFPSFCVKFTVDQQRARNLLDMLTDE